MEKIEYLPKFYERSDVRAKHEELKRVKVFLIESGKLTASERENLADMIDNYMFIKDSYSRNYVIRETNTLLDYIKCR